MKVSGERRAQEVEYEYAGIHCKEKGNGKKISDGKEGKKICVVWTYMT